MATQVLSNIKRKRNPQFVKPREVTSSYATGGTIANIFGQGQENLRPVQGVNISFVPQNPPNTNAPMIAEALHPSTDRPVYMEDMVTDEIPLNRESNIIKEENRPHPLSNAASSSLIGTPYSSVIGAFQDIPIVRTQGHFTEPNMFNTVGNDIPFTQHVVRDVNMNLVHMEDVSRRSSDVSMQDVSRRSSDVSMQDVTRRVSDVSMEDVPIPRLRLTEREHKQLSREVEEGINNGLALTRTIPRQSPDTLVLRTALQDNRPRTRRRYQRPRNINTNIRGSSSTPGSPLGNRYDRNEALRRSVLIENLLHRPGTHGERRAARRSLTRIMRRHGITQEELNIHRTTNVRRG
jgi:hypothetical protein